MRYRDAGAHGGAGDSAEDVPRAPQLSINFWLISPLLHLPFAPVVHPGLEAIFNWCGS